MDQKAFRLADHLLGDQAYDSEERLSPLGIVLRVDLASMHGMLATQVRIVGYRAFG